MAVLEEPPGTPPYKHKLFSTSPPDLDTIIASGHTRSERCHEHWPTKGLYSGRMRPQSTFSITSGAGQVTTVVGNAGSYRIIFAASTGNAIRRSSPPISSFGTQADAQTSTEDQIWAPAAVITGFEMTKAGPKPLPRSLTDEELIAAEFERVENWHRAQYFERFLGLGQWIYMPNKSTMGKKIWINLIYLLRSIRHALSRVSQKMPRLVGV